jgi:tetratricopeptide (TPR) repeat protein
LTSPQTITTDATDAKDSRIELVDTARLVELLTDFEQVLDSSMSPHRLALSDLGMDRYGFVPRPYSDTAIRHWRRVLEKDPDDIVTRHHLAIATHARAIDLEQSKDPTASDPHWQRALEHWAWLIEAEAFWDWLTQSIPEQDAQHEVHALRVQLPVILIQMHLDIAFDKRSPNHRAQFHMHSAKNAPLPKTALQTARKAVYERFSKRLPEEVWVSGQRDPETLEGACETLIHFLELDPENEEALTDLLRLQMGLLQARFVRLAAIGSDNPSEREEVLKQFARDGARCAPYFALLAERAKSLEPDIAESFVRWHRVMGDVYRALDDFVKAVAFYDAPSVVDGGIKDEARQCWDGAAECQALHALTLARAKNESALVEMEILQRRGTLTTWACFYGAQTYSLLNKHERAVKLCNRGILFDVKGTKPDTEYAAKIEEGKIHLRELLSNLNINRLLHQAQEYLTNDKPKKALDLVNEAGKISEDVNVLFLRSQCLIALKRWDQAEPVLVKCREVASGDPDALEALATLKSNLEYGRSLEDIVRKFKNNGINNAMQVVATHVKQARDDDARTNLSKALSAAAVQIANEQTELSSFDRVMAEVMERVHLEVNNLLHRAQENLASGKPEKALDLVDKVGNINKDGSALFLRSQCLIALKLWDQAAQALEKCHKITAGDPSAMEALATLKSNLEFSRSLDRIVWTFNNNGFEKAKQLVATHVKQARDRDARTDLSKVLSAAAVQIANEQMLPSSFDQVITEVMERAQSAAKAGLTVL